MASQKFSVLSGSTSISASSQFLLSNFSITGISQDNTSISKSFSLSGSIQDAINSINSSNLGISASISNGKFTLTSNYFSELSISASGNSDFLRVSGLGSFSVSNSSSSDSCASDLSFHSHGVSSSTTLSGGSIKSGSLSIQGADISVLGCTTEQVVENINNSGLAIAQLQGNILIIQSLNPGNLYISASDDAARVLGLADFSNSGGSVSAGSYLNHWNYSYDLWTKKYDDWDTSLDYSGYDSHNYNTHIQYKTTYEYRYQDEIWTDRSWGYQLSDGNAYGDKYRNQWSTSSIETNYTTHTVGTNWNTNYTTHTTGTNYNTSSSITAYGTSVNKSDGHWDYETNTTTSTSTTTDSTSHVIYQDGVTGSHSWESAESIIADRDYSNFLDLTDSRMQEKGYTLSSISYSRNTIVGGTSYVFDIYANYYKVGTTTYTYTTTTSTWVDGVDETITTATYWSTWSTVSSYDTSVETNSTISSYDYSTETNGTTWYKGGYQERTQDSAWESRDTGYNGNMNINNSITDDSSRVRNTAVQSRTWYNETYFSKDYSSSYNTEARYGYYAAPGFKFSDSSETQYRNVSSSHVVDSSSNGSITSSSAKSYGLDSAFAGQVGGTITVKSSYYGNVASFNYSSSTSLQSILNSLASLNGGYGTIFPSVNSSGMTTSAIYGSVTIEDSGNALKLAGFATDGTSRASTKTNSTNRDWNGLSKGSSTLTSSLSNMSSGSIRPFQGSGSFDVYVGSHKAGSVSYNANTTVGEVVAAINDMQYDFNTGKQVTTPFTNGFGANDDNSFDTGDKEDGSQSSYVDGSGIVHYTAQLQAYIDGEGRIVIKSDVYDTSATKITIKNDTGAFSALTGLSDEGHNYSSNSTLVNGDEGIYTYKGAQIAGMQANSNLTFVGGSSQGFYVTIDDGNRLDTAHTVNLVERKFFVNVYEGDTVQNVLDRMTQKAKDSGIGLNFSAKVENNRIVITTDGKYGECISFTGDTSGFVVRAGLSGSGGSSTMPTPQYDGFISQVNKLSESQAISMGYKVIKSVADLKNIFNNLSGKYILMNDIDMSGVDWTPYVGTFKGELNGNGFTIKNFSESRTGATGLFVSLNGATVKNLGFSNANVVCTGTSGSGFAGILAGNSFESIIDNVYVTNSSVTLNTTYGINNAAGGIIGACGQGNTISNCYTSNSNISGPLAAGITGHIQQGSTVSNCLSINNGNIYMVGGAANPYGAATLRILNCYSDYTSAPYYKGLLNYTAPEGSIIDGITVTTPTGCGETWESNYNRVIESYGYDRLTGSVDTITKSHVLGNLTSETFRISGGNGTYDVRITSGMSVAQIIDAIYSQTEGHYKAGIFNATQTSYDNATVGRFYIESTAQTPTDTTVTSTDLTRRLGLVAVNQTVGATTQTSTGDHGYFNYESQGIVGLKPNSIISGIKDGKLTFTLHETSATGQTGSITYRPSTSYTIDVVYNDTVTSILNKMKQAILLKEDETLEHGDVIGEDRLDRLDFKVVYDEATNRGYISLQLIGNYASGITFDADTSGFVQSLGLDKGSHSYVADYESVGVSSGKSMLTGSVAGLSANHIFGNMVGGSMVIKSGDISKTVEVKSTDRVQDVINKINEGGVFESGLDEHGRMYVKTAGQSSQRVDISGTTDFFGLVGLSGKSWSYSHEQETGNKSYSKVTGSVYGLKTGQTFNNMTSGLFYVKGSGLETVAVSVTKGVTTVGDVVAQINASRDFKAELDEVGRLVISTKSATGSTVQIDAGTTDYTKAVGLTAGTMGGSAVFESGVRDEYSMLKGSISGLNSSMRFSAGDFEIRLSDADGNMRSETFTLSGSETLSEVCAKISNSELGISAVMEGGAVVLRSKAAGGYTIELNDGTSNFAETVGFTKNGGQKSGTHTGSLSTLTSAGTVGNAVALGFSAGNFEIALTDTEGAVTSRVVIEVESTDTVDSVISKINGSGAGVVASINGAGNMVLTRSGSTETGGIKVSKGTSDFTNKVGFTSGGVTSSGCVNTAGTQTSSTVLKSRPLGLNLSDSLSEIGISAGTFSINSKVINIGNSETVSSLLMKINSAFSESDESGVSAEYVDGRVVLTSNSTNDCSRIEVESGSSNIAEVLGYTNAGVLREEMQEIGSNAKISINGELVESASNEISLGALGEVVETGSAQEQIRFTIKDVGSGVVDIGKQSLSGASSALNTFVNKFNNAMMLSQDKELLSDAGFVGLLNAIQSSLTDASGEYKQMTKSLSEIGITVYTTKTSGSSASKVNISLNTDKFVNAYLSDPQKVLDLLIGDDTRPIDSSKAGAFVRLQETMSNAVTDYFAPTIKNLESQAKSLSYEMANAVSEVNNVKATLGTDGNVSEISDDMSDYLKQLEAQYIAVNSLIKKMKKQYNQSISRLVLNGR